MSVADAVKRAVGDAQRFLGELSPPPNEANTCDWVIRPLLLALGYENFEISSQVGDVSNKFPDYTVLPQTEHTWYLEAKAWSVALESIHVDQALNYAHSNGRRWVVLSNGREWRLYDDRIVGKSADRLVATARLDETDHICRFLAALSRDSIQGKAVEVFAAERRVRDYLTKAVADAKSSVIAAVVQVAKRDLNISVSADSVVDILNAAHVTSSPEPVAKSQASVVVDSKEDDPSVKSVLTGVMSSSLAGLDPGTYQPVPSKSLFFADGTVKEIVYWKHILTGVGAWLSETGRLRAEHVPLRAGTGSKRYLVSSEPVHTDGKPFAEAVQIGTFFLETHYSARDCVRHAQMLLTVCGVPHETVRFG
jgi:predicted type IV restriction endonuclease